MKQGDIVKVEHNKKIIDVKIDKIFEDIIEYSINNKKFQTNISLCKLVTPVENQFLFNHFYKQPFYIDKYSNWVYDGNHNFVCQLVFKDEHQRNEVIFMLNSIYRDETINRDFIGKLTYNKIETQILMDDKVFIEIRGWGNLTGIGGHNFLIKKAKNIQDTFAEFIIERISK